MADKKTIPVKTWQFFSACKQNLGMSSLAKLFKRSPRQIDRWACNPDFAESSQRNPMDRYETLLKKLMNLGVDDIATAAVDRQAKIVGCTLRASVVCSSEKSIEAELLENLPALADYHEAVQGKKPLPIIRAKVRKLILEIEEDLALIEQRA